MTEGNENIWSEYSRIYRKVLPQLSFFRELQAKVIGLCQPYKKILDAGCGPGLYFEKLFEQGKDVYGIDLNAGMIESLKKGLGSRIPLEAIESKVIVGDIKHLPYKDNFFDAAINVNVLYNVPDPLNALKELHRAIRPGGALIIAGPVPKNAEGERILTKKILEEAGELTQEFTYVLKINKEILEKHFVNEISLEKITDMIIEAGFSRITYTDSTLYLRQVWLLKAEK